MRLHLSEREIESGRSYNQMDKPGNVWGAVGDLPGYTIPTGAGTFNAPNIRAMLVNLTLDEPQFITICCVAPINDAILVAGPGYPTEELIGNVIYGVGGYIADVDFDWLNGARITVFAQSVQVTCRRNSLSGASLNDPGIYKVSAFACIGAYGSSDATRTVTYVGAAIVPFGVAWPVLQVIPRMAKNVACHFSSVALLPTTAVLEFDSRTFTIVGNCQINIPYTDPILIPNACKFYNVGNAGLINNLGNFSLIFGLAL